MVNHREKGKVFMIRIKEQMLSRFAHRPDDSAQTENYRLCRLMHPSCTTCLTYFVILHLGNLPTVKYMLLIFVWSVSISPLKTPSPLLATSN